jgi:hypothetical protein
LGFFKKRDKPQAAPVQDRGSELDALYTRIRAGDQAATPLAWNIVLTVPKLYMIARGEMPAVQPYVGILEQRPMLAVFTTSERAHAFAVAQQLTGPGGAIGILEQSPSTVIATACNLNRAGVECVIVDMDPKDSTGMYAPISNLIGMFEQATGEMLRVCAPAGQGEFDHRVRTANTAQEPISARAARENILYRLLLLPDWFVVMPQGSTEIPIILQGGDPHLLVFTDPWNASQGLRALASEWSTLPEIRAIPVPMVFEFIRTQAEATPPLHTILVNATGEHIGLVPSVLIGLWDRSDAIRLAHTNQR